MLPISMSLQIHICSIDSLTQIINHMHISSGLILNAQQLISQSKITPFRKQSMKKHFMNIRYVHMQRNPINKNLNCAQQYWFIYA
jgi:hypothetical protein